MSTLPLLLKHDLGLRVALTFLGFLFHNLQVIIRNKLRDVHPHQRTRFHRADEALDTTSVVEAASELWVFKCDAGIFVGVGVPDLGVVPGDCLVAPCGCSFKVFGD